MKLKVGDKLKRIKESSSYFTKGRFYEIARVLEKDVQFIDNNGILHFWPIDELHEAFEIKQSKNQRITALEKEVAELKKILNEIQNGRKTMRDTIEEVLSEPSATDEIIEFEGNQYRKVDREARKGDVVIFKDGIKPVDWITIGKPYKATEGVDDCEKGEFIGDIYGKFPIYRYDDFNRTRETVDVYELIKQELTPNQQRAQIIKKAKKFVEVKKECVRDSTFVSGGISRKKKENPNFYNYAAVEVEFIINQEKHTVVSLVKFNDGSIMTKGIAKCNPSDVFNVHIGKAISLGRALGLDVSEFEQAVQPTEFAVGQLYQHIESGYSGTVRNAAARINGFKIINDTNAQYEEVK